MMMMMMYNIIRLLYRFRRLVVTFESYQLYSCHELYEFINKV